MVFVFDLDGTLLKKDYTISTETIEFLKSLEKCGHKIVFASGRMLVSVRKVINKFFQKEYPIIAYNGGMLHLPNKGVAYEKSIDFDNASKIISFLREENVHRQVYVDDKLYGEEDNDEIKSYAKHADVDYYIVDDLVKLIYKKPHKILSIAHSEKINTLKDKIKKLNLNVDAFKSMDIFLDIVPKNVSKGKALKFLLKKLEINEKLVVFGDNHNDISMFKIADISIAVENAVAELKREADYIAPSNDQNGVFFILNNLFSDLIIC